ncbi:glycosyltransferase family 4 protein [Pontibacter vulgaris]|uniref:glycosyltransferase family 4 protein n=1 Tax=Pontibacter vulgaris TaxID=2905679 RepID=UPI001FA79676|nr:glycosyltransferase family 4 protein [Pontibacter vulgaris]
MKVLISAYACEPNRGSEPGNGWNWAINVAMLGHEVWCLTCINGKKSIEKEVASLGLKNIHFEYISTSPLVRLLYKTQPGLYLYYLIWQRLALKRAKKLCRIIDFDLVHHVTWGSLQLATPLWRLNLPLIFGPVGGGQMAPTAYKQYFHNGWFLELQRNYTSKLLTRFNPNVKQTLELAQEVLVTNSDTLTLAKQLGAAAPTLFLDTNLPSEFIPLNYPERPAGKTLKILWAGRLLARKGLSLVLDALSKVDSAIDFTLTILGDGPMRKYIPGWIKKYNLQGKVHWQGHVPWDKMKEAYLTHDIFLFCSLRDSSAAQLLEAMAFGLPVITLDLHGARNLVPDGAGIKIPVNKPELTVSLISKAIERLYHQHDLRNKLGRSGYKFASGQVWSEKVKLLYSKLDNQAILPQSKTITPDCLIRKV